MRTLTKRFGERTAVDAMTATVRAGAVTGFLGPNGAGKSTTLRMVLGLDRPTAGTVTVAGRRFADLEAEGKGDQTKSNLKQAGEKVKDVFK